MTDALRPLDVAMLLERTGERDLPRDSDGMYVVTGTVPPTLLSRDEYDAGLKVLDYRERVAAGKVLQ